MMRTALARRILHLDFELMVCRVALDDVVSQFPHLNFPP
jgi:hypothetical protein